MAWVETRPSGEAGREGGKVRMSNPLALKKPLSHKALSTPDHRMITTESPQSGVRPLIGGPSPEGRSAT